MNVFLIKFDFFSLCLFDVLVVVNDILLNLLYSLDTDDNSWYVNTGKSEFLSDVFNLLVLVKCFISVCLFYYI